MQFLSFRELSITIPNSGATEMPITLLEARLAATPASVLAQEIYMMIPTRAEMRQRTRQIMETGT